MTQGETEEQSAVPLNLKSVEGVFYVTAGGIVLAWVFVVIEMILHVFQDSFQKKMSFREALRQEIAFYSKFGENVKPVIKQSSSKSSQKSREDVEEAEADSTSEEIVSVVEKENT